MFIVSGLKLTTSSPTFISLIGIFKPLLNKTVSFISKH